MTGDIVFTGEIMSETSKRLVTRYPTYCPLVESLMKMEELSDYEPLRSVKTWKLAAAL